MRKIFKKESDLWHGPQVGFLSCVWPEPPAQGKSGRQIEIYWFLFFITLRNPSAKNAALTNKSDNNTMN
jgi:hypothetical protein